MTVETLSEKLHCTVRELGSVIPVGRFHMLNVQRLLHSCYWYKAESRFLEAWHVLSAAILEARELGRSLRPSYRFRLGLTAWSARAPQGAARGQRRSTKVNCGEDWCIVDTWDW